VLVKVGHGPFTCPTAGGGLYSPERATPRQRPDRLRAASDSVTSPSHGPSFSISSRLQVGPTVTVPSCPVMLRVLRVVPDCRWVAGGPVQSGPGHIPTDSWSTPVSHGPPASHGHLRLDAAARAGRVPTESRSNELRPRLRRFNLKVESHTHTRTHRTSVDVIFDLKGPGHSTVERTGPGARVSAWVPRDAQQHLAVHRLVMSRVALLFKI